jgi:Flp pilus assembly protein TadG
MKTRLLHDSRGATMMEFALVAPVFVTLIIGIAQLGLLFWANAGLHNAVAEGARLATIFPRPDAVDIRKRINISDFGMNPAGLSTPVVNYVAGTPSYADIQMSYTTSINFIVYQTPITLTESRRVYLQPLPAK